MQWIVRLLCGCDPEEARIALRLYWQEHRRRLALIAGIELLVLAALIGLSFLIRLPGIPGPSYVYWTSNAFQNYVYPYALLPVVVVLALVIVPRHISFPPTLGMRAMELPWRIWAVVLASGAHAGYWFALYLETFPRFDPDSAWIRPLSSVGGAYLLFSQIAPWRLMDYLLVEVVLFVIAPSLILVSFLNRDQRWSLRFTAAATIWVLCHIAWNSVNWVQIDIGPGNHSAPLYVHYLLADALGIVFGVLLWFKPTRFLAFTTSCVCYMLIHVLALPLYLHWAKLTPLLYVFSFCGLWSMGLPPTVWSYFVDVIK